MLCEDEIASRKHIEHGFSDQNKKECGDNFLVNRDSSVYEKFSNYMHLTKKNRL